MEMQNDQTMRPSPSRPEPSAWSVLLLLVAASLLGTMAGSALALGWSQMQGVDLQTALAGLNENSDRPLRDIVRMANLLNHVVTFTVPALLVGLLLYQRRWWQYFKLDHFPSGGLLAVALVFVVASFPFTQITYWFNQQLPLPEWINALEEATQNMVEGLLVMEAPAELWFNLLVIAVLPAIGEELVFRGIVQQQLQRLLRRPAVAIWVTAIIFSAIHFQFAGFLPRMVLGAVLGYVFYWTRSLWTAILAHFITNGMQVIAQYVTDGKLTEENLDQLDSSDWISGVVSLGITLVLGYYLWQRYQATERKEWTEPGSR